MVCRSFCSNLSSKREKKQEKETINKGKKHRKTKQKSYTTRKKKVTSLKKTLYKRMSKAVLLFGFPKTTV
jgi:hypothetical protein